MLLVTYSQHCIKCASQQYASLCYWQFYLDKHLDLNVTFLLINFYLENLGCRNARLEMNKIVFCGIYTSFNVYPNHHKVWIQVHSTKCFYFQVHAKFILMDFSLLKTGDLTRYFSQIPPFDIVTLLKINTTIQLFLVEVKKNALALVYTLNICEVSVHDGPDVHANRLTSDNDLYKISTFQCFLVTKGSGSKCVVSYTQILENILVHFVKQSSSLTLPSNNCLHNHKICYTSIKVPQIYQLNATIISLLISQAAQSPNCKHSGLAILDITKENSMVCQNISEFQNSHVYSSNSTLTFVLYWYIWPPPIHMRLSLTTTECKAVRLDVCFLYYSEKYLWDVWEAQS